MELGERSDEVTQKHWRFMTMNLLRHQSQRSFSILHMKYRQPTVGSRSKRRTREYASPDSKKRREASEKRSDTRSRERSRSARSKSRERRRSHDRQRDARERIEAARSGTRTSRETKTPLSARLGAIVSSAESVQSQEPELAPIPTTPLVASVVVDPNRPDVSKIAYELPESFLNAKHYVTESSKFLLSRTAQNTFNLDQFYEEAEKACELIKRSQAFVSLLDQHRREAERRWLLEKGRAAQLQEEVNDLRAQLRQSGGTMMASNQKQFMLAINQLSWEAIRDSKQANAVAVKVSVTTDNAEKVLYQTQIVPAGESSTS